MTKFIATIVEETAEFEVPVYAEDCYEAEEIARDTWTDVISVQAA